MSSNPTMANAAFKLSWQQERAWLEHEAGVPQFVQGVIGLDAAPDGAKIRQAVEAVVENYEILRTVFRRQTGIKMPFQIIQEKPAFRWEQISAADLDEVLRREREMPWDFENGPSLRALLVSGPSRWHLILTLPAFCADVPTLKNLALEIGASYQGKDLDSEAMQYADLVEWQNEMLASEATKAGREFWRDLCRGINFRAIADVSVPLEKSGQGFDPAWVAIPAATDLLPALEREASKLNLSIDDLLLAAWNVLLFRLTGHSQVAPGSEFDGRGYEELSRALGPLARTLPLQVAIESAQKFRAVAKAVHGSRNEARNWQECFAWTGAENPSLPFRFSSYDLGGENQRFPLERVQVVSERYKLRLVAIRRGADLALELHYDASRLTERAVERIAGYYRNLLGAALANPDMAVGQLEILSAMERRQLVLDWNDTAAEYPRTRCLHELFEQQAARTPDRIAVRSLEQAFRYGELNQRANQLAHYLRTLGVGPDRPVGLLLERSAETLVAVLAIVKAGGAYVPLNPDNPPARLKQQLEGAAAVLTEAKLAARIPEFSGPRVLVDRDAALWANQPTANPAVHTTPENLVYIIYTSGSTGVPKGVGVRHRNLVNYAHFITRRLELENYPAGLQFATVSTLGADLGNTAIYPALISGGTLDVIPFEMSTDPQRFAAHLADHPMDVLKIVPSHLQALLQAEEAKKLLPRKYLILGGETLTPKLLQKLEALDPACEILNHYGPTETTVGSLTLQLNQYDWKSASLSSIPIGKPIANTQVYILDQNLEPVAIGVTGELYIAGAGVSAGYLGQAEKTAERFVRNPFASDAQAGHESSRMYRTGDLARYGEDGNIEFLGRGDDQVKVRGFRIELGEIEAALGRHPALKQAVVVAREDENGDKRLLAYAVLGRESTDPNRPASAEITGEELRAHLKEQLPDYMVPQAVVILPKLPLTGNGKIDRQALPEPEQAATKTYIGPRTQTEQAIAEIWAEVLRRPPNAISIDDNFFDLGGHSLLATQVVSRLRQRLHVEIPLRALFEAPTLTGLAERIAKTAAQTPEIPPIVHAGRDQPLPLSFAQQRLWVLDRIEPNNPLYNIARATRLRGELKFDALVRALNEIVRRHESLRTTIVAGADGEPVQRITSSLLLPVAVVDLGSHPESEREIQAREIAAAQAATPFDLSAGPLLRATLLKLGQSDHILLLTMHHIVSDAWSAGVFLQELSALYAAFSEGKPSPLAELEIQYGDYARWQRQFLAGGVLEQQLAYWREHLKHAPAVLQLPTDFPRPSRRSFAGAWEPIPLSAGVSENVRRFSQAQGVTPFMTLLAAFSVMLSRYSGAEHIVLGTDIANRTTRETERLIGFFINLLPLDTDVSGDPTFAELVKRVREVSLGAYAHQDLPFDKLVQELRPERSGSHNPIVQALFVMQNTPNERRALPGLSMESFPIPITRSKFDIAVFMTEGQTDFAQHWVYSTELFKPETVRRMASHFETLLGNALAEPGARISALEMFSERERYEREQERKERKQSQRKKLMAVEPTPVALPEAPEKE